MNVRCTVALLSCLAATCVGAVSALGEDGDTQVPLPLSRSVVVRRRDVVYTVEGHARIPPGVEISIQKGVRLRGGKDARLEVAGQLTVHGVPDTEVTISGVRIVPADQVQQLHLDECKFSSGSGVVTEEDHSTGGMITIENCEFDGSLGIRLSVHAGKVKVMSVQCDNVLRIVGIDREGKRNDVYGSIRSCKLRGGVDLRNIADLTVRANVIEGGSALLRDNRVLAFDGNSVAAGELVFEQAEVGRFGRTKIMKCDISSGVVRVHAPVGKRKRETVTIRKCWFQGETSTEKLAAIVQDRDDDPQNAIKVVIASPSKRPLDLAAD